MNTLQGKRCTGVKSNFQLCFTGLLFMFLLPDPSCGDWHGDFKGFKGGDFSSFTGLPVPAVSCCQESQAKRSKAVRPDAITSQELSNNYQGPNMQTFTQCRHDPLQPNSLHCVESSPCLHLCTAARCRGDGCLSPGSGRIKAVHMASCGM